MIEVTNLTKRYGSVTAVDELSFRIEPGHIYGFLGPNGAGKSTTMNIMTGCLAATSGEVRIGGYDIFEQSAQAKKLVGYLPEQPPLYAEQTPREYLEFVADAKGVKRPERTEQIERVLKETGTEKVADRLIRNLSKGYRQRVGIAQAILGNPEVIILDEPTVGLDPMQILEIRDLIRKLGETRTVILSSHILAEVQEICDRILIIHHGHLIAFDERENLGKALSAGTTVDICAKTDRAAAEAVLAGIQSLGMTECTCTEELPGRCCLTLRLGSNEPLAKCELLFRAFSEADIPLLTLTPVHATLEDIYLKLTGDVPEKTENTQEPAEETTESENGEDAE